MRCFVHRNQNHFDDPMAYGSHHFLTNFRFQRAAELVIRMRCWTSQPSTFPSLNDPPHGEGPGNANTPPVMRGAVQKQRVMNRGGTGRGRVPSPAGQRFACELPSPWVWPLPPPRSCLPGSKRREPD